MEKRSSISRVLTLAAAAVAVVLLYGSIGLAQSTSQASVDHRRQAQIRHLKAEIDKLQVQLKKVESDQTGGAAAMRPQGHQAGEMAQTEGGNGGGMGGGGMGGNGMGGSGNSGGMGGGMMGGASPQASPGGMPMQEHMQGMEHMHGMMHGEKSGANPAASPGAMPMEHGMGGGGMGGGGMGGGNGGGMGGGGMGGTGGGAQPQASPGMGSDM